MSRDPRLRSPSRRPDPITLVWLGGIGLAVLAYAVGPGHFVAQVLEAMQRAGWFLDELVHNLTAMTINLVRAAAIGLYGTFVALCVLAIRRGAPARSALVVVSLVFLMLVWGAEGTGHTANLRWAAALILSGVAALSITRRLSH